MNVGKRYESCRCQNTSALVRILKNTTKQCSHDIFKDSDLFKKNKQSARTWSVQFDKNVATFSCHRNFHQQSGDLIRNCLPNGTWSGEQPVCKEDYLKDRFTLSAIIISCVAVLSIICLCVDFVMYRLRKREGRMDRKRKMEMMQCLRLRAFPKVPDDELTRHFSDRKLTLNLNSDSLSPLGRTSRFLSMPKEEATAASVFVTKQVRASAEKDFNVFNKFRPKIAM